MTKDKWDGLFYGIIIGITITIVSIFLAAYIAKGGIDPAIINCWRNIQK